MRGARHESSRAKSRHSDCFQTSRAFAWAEKRGSTTEPCKRRRGSVACGRAGTQAQPGARGWPCSDLAGQLECSDPGCRVPGRSRTSQLARSHATNPEAIGRDQESASAKSQPIEPEAGGGGWPWWAAGERGSRGWTDRGGGKRDSARGRAAPRGTNPLVRGTAAVRTAEHDCACKRKLHLSTLRKGK